LDMCIPDLLSSWRCVGAKLGCNWYHFDTNIFNLLKNCVSTSTFHRLTFLGQHLNQVLTVPHHFSSQNV
jgi:hypothetical protein